MAGGHWLEPGEYTLTMVADDDRASTTLAGGTGVVVLDVDLTPELEQEGRARDLVRLVQQARRDADLAVTDRIARDASRADREWVDAARAHEALIAAETLAVEVATVRRHAGSATPRIELSHAWRAVDGRLRVPGSDHLGGRRPRMAATKKTAAKQPAEEVRTGEGHEGAPRRRPTDGAGQGARPRRRRPKAAGAGRGNGADLDIPAPRGTTKDGIAYTKDFDVKFLKTQHDLLLAERKRPARPGRTGSRTRPTR